MTTLPTIFGKYFQDRELLEQTAKRIVCECQYYDLVDFMSGTSNLELLHVIFTGLNCPMCDQKGGR